MDDSLKEGRAADGSELPAAVAPGAGGGSQSTGKRGGAEGEGTGAAASSKKKKRRGRGGSGGRRGGKAQAAGQRLESKDEDEPDSASTPSPPLDLIMVAAEYGAGEGMHIHDWRVGPVLPAGKAIKDLRYVEAAASRSTSRSTGTSSGSQSRSSGQQSSRTGSSAGLLESRKGSSSAGADADPGSGVSESRRGVGGATIGDGSDDEGDGGSEGGRDDVDGSQLGELLEQDKAELPLGIMPKPLLPLLSYPQKDASQGGRRMEDYRVRLITGTEMRARARQLVSQAKSDVFKTEAQAAGSALGAARSAILQREWNKHFVECKLCERLYPTSTEALEMRYCSECRCSVCLKCDCSVYHLEYRLSLLDQLEATQEEQDRSKADAKRSKRAKKK